MDGCDGCLRISPTDAFAQRFPHPSTLPVFTATSVHTTRCGRYRCGFAHESETSKRRTFASRFGASSAMTECVASLPHPRRRVLSTLASAGRVHARPVAQVAASCVIRQVWSDSLWPWLQRAALLAQLVKIPLLRKLVRGPLAKVVAWVEPHSPAVLLAGVAFPRKKEEWRSTTTETQHETVDKAEALAECREEMFQRGAGDLAAQVGMMELNSFAEACNWDAERTITCLKETMEWKKKQRFADEREKRDWDECARRIGNDVEGKPAIYVSVAQVLHRIETSYIGSADEGYAAFINCTVSLMEDISLEKRESVGFKCVVLVDFTDVKLHSIPWRSLKQLISVLIKHFPRRLGKLYLVNAPAVVRIFLATVLKMMPTHTRAKAQLVCGEECTSVFQLFDKANLPAQLLTKGKSKAKEPLTESGVVVNAASYFDKLSTTEFAAPLNVPSKASTWDLHVSTQAQAGAVVLFAVILYVCAQLTTAMHTLDFGTNHQTFS